MSTVDVLLIASLYFFGVLVMAAACFNWNWFFSFKRTTLPQMILGRTGARVLYFLCGFFLFLLAGGMLFGLVRNAVQ